MTVQQLIDELQKYPKDMPVAIMCNINPSDIKDPNFIKVSKHTWVDSNYHYNKPDFDYINLE
jgi:hypothetical protein